MFKTECRPASKKYVEIQRFFEHYKKSVKMEYLMLRCQLRCTELEKDDYVCQYCPHQLYKEILQLCTGNYIDA